MKEELNIPQRGQFKAIARGKVPEKWKVKAFLKTLVAYLFPLLADKAYSDSSRADDLSFELMLKEILNSFETGLSNPEATLKNFFKIIPDIYRDLVADARAIFEGDPAARSVEEVIISYPGFYAIAVYRIAHALDDIQVPVLPRMLTEYAHSKTGIDIHPKARIGKSFCIDHGTGIVIGETTEIGSNVKIYQGVTLGAISVSKKKAAIKRHPTIEDHVTIYSGATILGGKTIIGRYSVIGGNVWLTHSIDRHSIILNKNEVVMKNNGTENNEFTDYII